MPRRTFARSPRASLYSYYYAIRHYTSSPCCLATQGQMRGYCFFNVLLLSTVVPLLFLDRVAD